MISNSDTVLRPRMPELDTLRGIAVLLVLLFHAFKLSPYHTTAVHGAAGWFLRATAGGWIGVNLFFVLSGFLITGILLETRSQPDYYRRFCWRRALRILPAYCPGMRCRSELPTSPGSILRNDSCASKIAAGANRQPPRFWYRRSGLNWRPDAE